MHSRTTCAVIAALLFALPCTARTVQQRQQDPRRQAIDKQLAKELAAFARKAAAQKAFSLAREVARLVVEHYDANSNSARRLLGQRKVRGAWASQGKTPPPDAIDARRRRALDEAWQGLRGKACALHRELGLALQQEGKEAAAIAELELALTFVPDDAACHRALGHEEFEGFWGSSEEVGCRRRLRAIRDQAAVIAQHEFDVERLDAAAMPAELKRMGIALYGAKSEHYTYWCSESVEAAANCAIWSERCHELLQFLLGDRRHLVRAEAWRWHAVLRTAEQRDLLLTRSPSTCGPFTFEQARLFVGIGFALEGGGRASVTWEPNVVDNDYAVANVTKRHFLDQRNDGLGEGLVHVMTWLLCGSTNTYFADLAKTVSGDGKPIARDPKRWQERLRKEVAEGRDMPLAVVPREDPSNFRDSTRLKSWSFMLWMLGRHPDKWLPLIDEVSKERLTPNDVDAAFRKVFGHPPETIDSHWRNWYRTY